MEKLIKRMMNKRSAKLTVELSIMIAILVVVVIAVLVMFGQGLRDVAQNSGFAKNMLNQETIAKKTEYESFNRTQENIAVTGVQGITAKFDAEHPEEWINDVFATLLTKDPTTLSDEDLEALARALAMANKNNTDEIKDYDANHEKCKNLEIENKSNKGTVSYTNKDGVTKELNYKDKNEQETKVVNKFLYETAFEKAEN